MSWQLLIALNVLTFSVSMVLRRVLLRHETTDSVAYVIIFQGMVGVLTGIYALLHGFHMPDLGRYWLPMLVTVLLYAAGHLASTAAFRRLEASVFSVLFATSAVWTMAAGPILFSDRLSLLQIVGTVLVLASVLLLVDRRGLRTLDRGLLFGLLTSALFGLATAGWAYVGRHADVPSWTALSFIGPSLAVLLLRPRAVLRMRPFLSGHLLAKMLALGAIFSVSSLASLFAYRDGNVGAVAVLQQTSIIVTTILGVIFLHERTHLCRKALAAAICFAAVLLIV